jgi:SAM-dependent methyltransferase
MATAFMPAADAIHSLSLPPQGHVPAGRARPPDAAADTAALVRVGQWLKAQSYAFTTITPASHALVLARRAGAVAQDLREVFGWNMPFVPSVLPADVLQCLKDAGLVNAGEGGLLRSAVRFSTLGELLLPHSAFPTDQGTSVFFGPDTYRFASLIRRELERAPLGSRPRILDVGCGTGAGGLVAAAALHSASPQIVFADISATALRYAQASAVLAGAAETTFVQGDLFAAASGTFDLVVANPPYLNDASQRLYRHGGGRWGEALSLRIVQEVRPRLAPGGRLVLYTGSAIAARPHPLRKACSDHLAGCAGEWSYEEIDPDVFGEELAKAAYADVDRIAAVTLTLRVP